MEQTVLVCGSRKFNDRVALNMVLDAAHTYNPIKMMITGGATGADTLADDWARHNAVPRRVFKANWKKYGNPAGPIRNGQMLVEGKPDVVIAFPGGDGTADMIRQAEAAGVPVVKIKERTP